MPDKMPKTMPDEMLDQKAKKSRLKIISSGCFINIKPPSEIQLSGCSARRKPQQYTSIARIFNAFHGANNLRPKIGFMEVVMVPRKGLEPPRSYSLVPETSASTNSATWASQERRKLYQEYEPNQRLAG
jgi:hypothetical protein